MDRRHLALACLLGGIALLAYDVARGDAAFGVILVFPVLIAEGLASLAGVLLLFAAFALYASHVVARGAPGGDAWAAPPADPAAEPSAPQRRARGGAIVLIGPLPILIGSDRRTALVLAALMAVVVVVLVLLSRLGA